MLYNHDESENSNSRKISINESLFPYYRKLYGIVKDLSNEGLIDSFLDIEWYHQNKGI